MSNIGLRKSEDHEIVVFSLINVLWAYITNNLDPGVHLNMSSRCMKQTTSSGHKLIGMMMVKLVCTCCTGDQYRLCQACPCAQSSLSWHTKRMEKAVLEQNQEYKPTMCIQRTLGNCACLFVIQRFFSNELILFLFQSDKLCLYNKG